MHARSPVKRTRETYAVRTRRRVIPGPDADRRRHERGGEEQRKHLRHAIPLVALVALLAGCGGGSGAKQGLTIQPARTYSLELTPTTVAAGSPRHFACGSSSRTGRR